MALRLTSAIAASTAALALAACGEAEDGTSFEITAANGLTRVAGDCVYAPQAGAAAADAGLNVAEAPEKVGVLVAGTGSRLDCHVENLLPEPRGEEHPPRAAAPAAKPSWWSRFWRAARGIRPR